MALSENLENIAFQVLLYEDEEKTKSKRYRKDEVPHPLLPHDLSENNLDDLKNEIGMSEDSFRHLLNLVTPKIARKDTVMRKCISAEQRLVSTLRYLATGRSLEDLKFSTGISAQALGHIIPETCQAIYDVLRKEFLKFPKTSEEWQKIAEEFDSLWNFPNCGGVIDGKHVSIVPPSSSRSYYYNYKGYFSVILLTVVNANLEFLMVDVGKNGCLSNAEIVEEMLFYNKLVKKSLDLPDNNKNKHGLNFVFLGNEAFESNDHLLHPYPVEDLNYEKKIFNYRFSRARRVVENAFGVLSSRFRVFQTSMGMKPEKIDRVVLACCALHNYLRRNCRELYTPESFIDCEDTESACIGEGLWRRNTSERFFAGLEEEDQPSSSDITDNTRSSYQEYFNGIGKVPWQDKMVF